MKTRILIPKGLQIIITGDDSDKKTGRRKLHKTAVLDEENEEKPSSSSGHCETGSDPLDVDQINKYNSSSSSSTSSSSTPEASSDSDTDDDGESEMSISRNSLRSENVIGSSESTSDRKNKRRRKKISKRENKNFQDGSKEKGTVQSRVKICATRLIEKGTMFTPNDGDVQVVHLKGVPAIPRDDVRFLFGCFETIAPATPLTPTSPPGIAFSATTTTSPESDEGLIRLCNWIRFLPSVKSSSSLEGRISSITSSDNDSSDSEVHSKVCSEDHHDSSSSGSKATWKNYSKQSKANTLDPDYKADSRENTELSSAAETMKSKMERKLHRQRYSDGLQKNLKTNNIIARFADGRSLFEATTRLVPGTELVAYFDMDSFHKRSSSSAISSLNAMMMMGPNPPFMKPSWTQQNNAVGRISSTSPPPAPSSSTSTIISSSSSSSLVGRGNNTDNGKESDRDEKGPPFHQHSLFSFYPYALHHHHYYHQQQQQFFGGRGSMLQNTEESMKHLLMMKSFGGNGNGGGGDCKNNMDYANAKSGIGLVMKTEADDAHVRSDDEEEKLENETNADGPLDLTTLNTLSQDSKPVMRKSNSHTSFTRTPEPLKIGTPFDSPDSNDDDKSMILQDRGYFGQELRRSSRDAHTKTGSSQTFSIRNVLKRKSSPSPPPHKLFQPYCFDNEKEKEVSSWKRGAQMNAGQMLNQNASSFRSTPLSTPPHRASLSPAAVHVQASSPAAVAVPVLRPILRTRGRERSLLPCEVCGKAFDRPSLLKRHLRTHTGEKPHVCDVCSKGFSTSSSLNTHRRIHSGEKPHQCPICGKRFTASSNLYYHRMTHNKEKPHKCMLCGKSFPTPGDLKSHQYVHSGSWPYTCPVCHRGFSKQTNLRNHLLLHSGMGSNTISNKPGEKPHTCHICDKKFALASNLRAHLKTHEETDASSTCGVCKRSFLPSLNMLVNGRCRSCIYATASTNSDGRMTIDSQRSSNTTSPQNVHLNQMVNSFPTMNMDSALMTKKLLSPSSIHGMAQLAPQQNPLTSFGLPQISTFQPALPGTFSLPGNTLAASGFHFPPTSSVNSTATPNSVTAAAAALFRNAGGGSTPATNPFIEHLLELNYRYAKETAGSLSLGLMQQKLLESQMFAAQLMTSQGFGMSNGSTALQDILKLRAAAAGADGFRQMDSVATENKFMQR